MLIKMTKSAIKFIERLPPKQAKQVAMKVFALGSDPYPQDHVRMKGASREHIRSDVGEFRVVYEIQGETVIIEAIGKRNDDEVYRKFDRK